MGSLCYTDKFNFKDECRAARDAWLGKSAIPHFCRYINFPFVANVHFLKGDNPAFDKIAEAASQWCATTTAVKYFAIDSSPRIVGGDDVAWCGLCTIFVAFVQYLVIYAFGQSFHTFCFGSRLQPALVRLYVISV